MYMYICIYIYTYIYIYVYIYINININTHTHTLKKMFNAPPNARAPFEADLAAVFSPQRREPEVETQLFGCCH